MLTCILFPVCKAIGETNYNQKDEPEIRTVEREQMVLVASKHHEAEKAHYLKDLNLAGGMWPHLPLPFFSHF